MKQPTFLEGAAIALMASLLTSVLFAALTPLMAGGTVLRLLVMGLTLAYLLYLLQRSGERTGRVVVLVAWGLLAIASGVFEPALSIFLLIHVMAIWAIRCLFHHASLLAALADLGLSGLSLAAAIWAFGETQSLFLGCWCFFLTQALFVAIPEHNPPSEKSHAPSASADTFEKAYQAAQAAAKSLSSRY